MPLALLLKLHRMQLPVRVTDPTELRKLSVLAATGLVDARFETIRLRALRAESTVATVNGITEDGWIEIATAGNFSATRPSFRFQGALRLL